MDWITTYTRGISATTRGGDATEHSYRTDIDNMLKAAVREFEIDITVLHEPSRRANLGAPDFRISSKGGGIIGYVECKTPGENLNKLITSAQLKKYAELSRNILLTDSWQWMLLRNGKKVATAVLSEKPNKKARDAFAELLRVFLDTDTEKIGDAAQLAAALARRCTLLREGLEMHSEDYENSALQGCLSAFKMVLDPELEFKTFANVFAQTYVYSLLIAKLKAPANETLDLHSIKKHIPTNFALIREVASFVQELDDSEYENIEWVVSDILAIINEMNAVEITESMSYKTVTTDEDDPYFYFYEKFLAAYDAKLRDQRGVYYTPPPVVKFIVRAVDDLLKRDFGLSEGLAKAGTVTALDFAAGTGTFMLEMFRTVLNGKSQPEREMLAREHICENFYGFELLMVPYVIAHLKLSQFLADHDALPNKKKPINILLTNTLEKISEQVQLPYMPKLAEEANRAQHVKDSPVLVITGNPPYAVASQNKSQEQFLRTHKRNKKKKVKAVRDTWIGELMNAYKFVDGKPLGERNPKSLQDDYVKFIRFAQWKMETVDNGIVAIITNHAFLSNITFKGMRKSLMDTFDTMYFLDLHGHADKKEIAPDGGKDKNVFPIKLGVAISLLIKNSDTKEKKIFLGNFYGSRESKLVACLENDINSIKWEEIKPVAPLYLFASRDKKSVKAKKIYDEFYSIKNIFMEDGNGIKTHRDDFAYAFNSKDMKTRIKDMINKNISTADFIKDHLPNKEWSNLEKARDTIRASHSFDKNLRPCLYRPFDTRWCYYSGAIMDRHRPEIMSHMLQGENVGLVTVRQVAEKQFNHVFVTNKIVDTRITLSNRGAGFLFPLYRYDAQINSNGNGQEFVRNENFNPKFRKWINEKYGVTHTPENIFGYIYAVLHSPTYREKYVDFLRTEYSRIPFSDDNDEFNRLAKIGNQIKHAHLLEKHCGGKLAKLEGSGTRHIVEKVNYDDQKERLYFNKEEYFAPIPPEVFNFQIGGYLPLDKYLKSRKGLKLNLTDLDTIKYTANAIAFTIKKMQEIDNPV